MFNAGRYVERAQSGELTEQVVENRHPTSPKAHLPLCTWSQEVVYLDRNGDEVAKAHRYLLPDGSIGGAGRPDPKKVYRGGILYVAWTKRQHHSP